MKPVLAREAGAHGAGDRTKEEPADGPVGCSRPVPNRQPGIALASATKRISPMLASSTGGECCAFVVASLMAVPKGRRLALNRGPAIAVIGGKELVVASTARWEATITLQMD